MHGFFLLPPERNHKEASHVAEVIAQLTKQTCFHYLKTTAFILYPNKISSLPIAVDGAF